jgi:hypothetical protein
VPPHTQWFKLRDPHGPFRRCHPTPLFCELFSYRHPPLEERPRHALEPAPLVYPQDVSLDGDLGGHLSVMHSPEETTQQAGQVPAMQIEAAQRAAWWSEASGRQFLRIRGWPCPRRVQSYHLEMAVRTRRGLKVRSVASVACSRFRQHCRQASWREKASGLAKADSFYASFGLLTAGMLRVCGG